MLSATGSTKVCRDRDCEYDGMAQSLLCFTKNRSRPGGYDYICKSCHRRVSKIARSKKPDAYREKEQEYKRIHRNRLLELQKLWRRENPDYYRGKYRTDPSYKVSVLCRSRIYTLLYEIGVKKENHLVELTGCSSKKLREHIESLFSEGMSWDNHSATGWHIDHIRPCKSFDLTDAEQQKACFHYTNLQPLWAPDNLSKGSRWIE